MTNVENDEMWYAQLDNGEVLTLTLDQLDEYFENGVIHENTYVVEVGGSDWQTLAVVAGLGEDEQEEAETAEPPKVEQQASASPFPAQAPAAASPFPTSVATPGQAASPFLSAAASPFPSQPPASNSPFPSQPPASASPFPQAIQVPTAANPFPPVQAASVPPQSGAIHGASVAPVVQDVSSLDIGEFKPRRNMAPLYVAAAALLAFGGIAFAAMQMDDVPTTEAAVEAAAPAAASPLTPQQQPAELQKPAPGTDTASKEKAEKKDRLSEETKAALLAADEERENKKKSPTGRKWRAPKKQTTGLKSSGNAYDPLNGEL